jgi:hypothetical protein
MVIVNYWAVLVGGILSFVLGGLWYGPIFGKKWIALSKFSPEDMAAARAKGMTKSYILMFITSLIMSYVLFNFIAYEVGFSQQGGALSGAVCGFFAWLGFVMPVTLGSVLWEGKSYPLWFINTGYYLVSLVIVGAVLAAWM